MIKRKLLNTSLFLALVLSIGFGEINVKANSSIGNANSDTTTIISKNENASTNIEASLETKFDENSINANLKYEDKLTSSTVVETSNSYTDEDSNKKTDSSNEIKTNLNNTVNNKKDLIKSDNENSEFKKDIIDNSESINKFIYSLDYDKDTILATQGEAITSFSPKTGIKKDHKFIVVEKTQKSIDTTPIDVSIIDSTVSRSYPGALQLANKNLIENKPDLLTVARKPINISVNLPGLGASNYVTVDNPSYRTVNAAIDTLIDKWSNNYSGTHTLPAITEYKESMVHSKSQIAAALNVNANFLEKTLGIDFDAIQSGEKQVMIASYKQIFYTVNADVPESPSDLFANTVTPEALQLRGVNKDNAPLLVTNVAYGRRIFVKLETNNKNTNVNSAFSFAMKNLISKGSGKYEDILDGSDFTAVVLGGDAQIHNKIVSKNFDEIRDIIKDNATFSITNPGYPISYTSIFLKDGSVAAIHNHTDYIETKSKEFAKGKINIYHKGAYVAQFKITWEEISYDENGNEIIEKKAWDQNWWDKTSPFTTTIPLPANAKNIKIYAREATGLVWDRWWTIVNETVDLNKNINLTIWGTTLNPHSSLTFDNN